MTVRVVDNGANALLLQAEMLASSQGGLAVNAGVVGEAADEPLERGITMGELAIIHELGLGQEERTWLRGWFDENQEEIAKRLEVLTVKVLKGRMSMKRARKKLGKWAVKEIKARIRAGIQPPLAESTIERKGHDLPLVHSGRFLAAIGYEDAET